MRFYGGAGCEALLHLFRVAGAHSVGVGAAGVHHPPGVVTDEHHVKPILGVTAGSSLDTATPKGARAMAQRVVISPVTPAVVIVEVGTQNFCSEILKFNYLSDISSYIGVLYSYLS